MHVKTGLMWPPDRGTVAIKNKKALMKTAKGIISLGSTSCESKHAIMEVDKVTIREAVATNSVIAAFHV
jgi:hypothetical protein